MAKSILSKDNFSFNELKRAAQFWTKVNITANPDECWEWQSYILPDKGYGQMPWGGGRSNKYQTHRIAYFLHTGIFPSDSVLHSCDNRACCNPNHLREGTHQDNMDDMIARHRSLAGERNLMTKLTSEEVWAIRDLQGKQTSVATAKQFNTTHASILNIWRRFTWKRLPEREAKAKLAEEKAA